MSSRKSAAATMSNSSNRKRTSWPEVEGVPSEAAKHKILADRPDVQVIVLPYGSVVTDDYNTERVRVYFDYFRNVVGIPKVG